MSRLHLRTLYTYIPPTCARYSVCYFKIHWYFFLLYFPPPCDTRSPSDTHSLSTKRLSHKLNNSEWNFVCRFLVVVVDFAVVVSQVIVIVHLVLTRYSYYMIWKLFRVFQEQNEIFQVLNLKYFFFLFLLFYSWLYISQKFSSSFQIIKEKLLLPFSSLLFIPRCSTIRYHLCKSSKSFIQYSDF